MSVPTPPPKRPPGRPRSAVPGSTVSTWVPASDHDKLVALARRRDTSVSEMLRRVIVFVLRDKT